MNRLPHKYIANIKDTSSNSKNNYAKSNHHDHTINHRPNIIIHHGIDMALKIISRLWEQPWNQGIHMKSAHKESCNGSNIPIPHICIRYWDELPTPQVANNIFGILSTGNDWLNPMLALNDQSKIITFHNGSHKIIIYLHIVFNVEGDRVCTR